jgi:hypothetical protein
MKLKLTKFDEDTGMCELEVDDEAKQFLMEQGFNAVLRKTLEEIIENEREKNNRV